MSALKEIARSSDGRGATITTGLVKDHEAIGCPEVDTIYLKFKRKTDGTHFFAFTPKEAVLVSELLKDAVFAHVKAA